MQSIPYFFPAKRISNKGNPNAPRRATQATAAKSFIPIFETPEEARTFYNSHDFGTPRVHLIGTYADVHDIKAAVTIDDRSYEFDNILYGIHFCFCAFFALKVEYPVVSSSFWLVLQQLVYKIHLGCDKAIQTNRNISFKKEILNIIQF